LGQWDVIKLLRDTGEKLSNLEIRERLNTYGMSFTTCKLFHAGILDRETRHKAKLDLQGRYRDKNNMRGCRVYYVYWIRDGVTDEQLERYKPVEIFNGKD